MRNIRLQAMIEAAIFAVLALALDMFVPSIKIGPSISISFAMIPVFIVALRWGFKFGFLSGFLWGLLQVIFDPWIIHPIQGAIDYFLAFSFIGFAGLFKNTVQDSLSEGNKGKSLLYIIIAIFVGSLARYFWHFVSGYVFFAEQLTGFEAIWFSLTANGITMLGAFAFCSIIMTLLILSSPRFFVLKQELQGHL
ncbi:energy-coupled thiamine transporter ThiT [Bacillus sinesaloumensis]|uniref:energy-coupled thiamine transporter ThiT n=1 Tax=Litchfieldia sinesaloumensis TaxID=1926280 RepID=UPI00098877E9|nr:energy-coupled thiamine transporter ThiT [Bacillus sinesaloumensis]